MTAALRETPVQANRYQRVMRLSRRALLPAAALSVAALLWVGVTMLYSASLDATRIQSVRVEGSFGARTQSEIEQSLSALVAGQSLLDVPMTDISHELGNLSWVSAVDVYRVWPHGLIVRVTEKVPVAHWNGDGFISHAGEVFQPEGSATVNSLPALYGPEEKAPQVMAFYSAVNSMMMPLGLSAQEVRLNEELSWEIVTGSGIRIRVEQDEALTRVRRFLRIYERQLAPVANRIDSVDLRYIGGFAVHWAPAVTALDESMMRKMAGAQAPGGDNGTYTQ